MMRRIFCLFIISLCFIAVIISANAQEVPVVQEEWNPPVPGPVTTQPPLCGRAKFVAQQFFFFNNTRGSFDSEGHYKSLPKGDKKYQYQEQLYLQYGITDHLEVDAQTVYQQNYIKQGDLKAHDNGLGDSSFWLRYCPVEEGKWLPGITGLIQVKVPTGKYQHADPNKLGTDLNGASSSAGAWAPGFGVILLKKIKPFILHFDSIYSFPQEVGIDGVKTRYANFLNVDGAVEYVLPKGFSLLMEANAFWQGDRWQDGSRLPASDSRSLTVVPGIGWSNDKFQALLAYQRVVTGTNTDANDSIVLTGIYTF